MNNRVRHFEIPSKDPETNMKFFSEVFGWRFEQFGKEPYWLAITGDDNSPGINGAIMKEVAPGQPLINTIGVENIDDMIKTIEKKGGKIHKAKQAIPSVGWLAFFSDPDGNMHGIMQDDKNAK
jgi:predicted enzyme related to lactoylglutathione lyase